MSSVYAVCVECVFRCLREVRAMKVTCSRFLSLLLSLFFCLHPLPVQYLISVRERREEERREGEQLPLEYCCWPRRSVRGEASLWPFTEQRRERRERERKLTNSTSPLLPESLSLCLPFLCALVDRSLSLG